MQDAKQTAVVEILKKAPKVPLTDFEYYCILAAIVALVLIGGLGAGLTIGLMSIDKTTLKILKRSGSETQKLYANRIEPLLQNPHLLLVTLLLTNTIVNESLPVLFHSIDMDGIAAVLASTALIVIFGEIIPQAVCARYGLAIGAFFAYPVRALIYLEYIIAFPIAKLLDLVLGKDHGVVYRRAELKELVELHGENHEGILTKDEVQIVKAVLSLREMTVKNIMTHLDNVFMLSLDSKLDRKTMDSIDSAGHSRVPVYSEDKQNIIGVVLVKQLLPLDPDDATPLKQVKIRSVPRIKPTTPLFEILHVFEAGASHMALVVDYDDGHSDRKSTVSTNINNSGGLDIEKSPPPPPKPPGESSTKWVAKSPLFPFGSGGNDDKPRPYRILGIVTLEDVIEEIIGSEIVDETDVFIDVQRKVRVASAFKGLIGINSDHQQNLNIGATAVAASVVSSTPNKSGTSETDSLLSKKIYDETTSILTAGGYGGNGNGNGNGRGGDEEKGITSLDKTPTRNSVDGVSSTNGTNGISSMAIPMPLTSSSKKNASPGKPKKKATIDFLPAGELLEEVQKQQFKVFVSSPTSTSPP